MATQRRVVIPKAPKKDIPYGNDAVKVPAQTSSANTNPNMGTTGVGGTDAKLKASRTGAGQYSINGKTFSGMASGDAALAAYNKKYGGGMNATAKNPGQTFNKAEMTPFGGEKAGGAMPTSNVPGTGGPLEYTPSTGGPLTLDPSAAGGFRGIEDFMAKDITSSPAYQYRLGEGQKSLDRLYAARGLKGSGAEIGGNAKMINELTGTETDKAREFAMNNANRFDSQAQNFANNKLQSDQQAWGRISDTLGFMERQNPMQYADSASKAMSDYMINQGKTAANYNNNSYTRATGGGGGGGGMNKPAYLPPTVTPSNNNINLINNAGNLANTTSRNNLLNNALSWAFSPSQK